MVGRVVDASITLKPVHRFPNRVLERDGRLCWDIDRLVAEVGVGLEPVSDAVSVGIDTWGVDYGLLDERGVLLGPPVSYRDPRGATEVDSVHAGLPFEELYRISGTQFLSFNTVYQLASERRRPDWARVARILLMPDLITYLLCGASGCELTNASTTALLDASTGDWSDRVLKAIDVERRLLAPRHPPGVVSGAMPSGVTVLTVGSHDTASAVVAVPATTDRFAYICCGTWALVGMEIDRPVLSDDARSANFTNELGVDGRIRFLRNVGGLWLLQECLREWGQPDPAPLLAEAGALPVGGPVIEAADPAWVAPGGMPDRIAVAADRALTPAQTVRCILDSLAVAFASTVHEAARLATSPVEVIHMVGGGSQNGLLCRLTARAAGLPVIAGPVEATAIGNIAVQARAAGVLPSSLEEIRAGIAATQLLRRYEP
jgi:rhamnulokinase